MTYFAYIRNITQLWIETRCLKEQVWWSCSIWIETRCLKEQVWWSCSILFQSRLLWNIYSLKSIRNRLINILAFCSTQFLYLFIISKIKLVLILYSKWYIDVFKYCVWVWINVLENYYQSKTVYLFVFKVLILLKFDFWNLEVFPTLTPNLNYIRIQQFPMAMSIRF